MPLNLLLMLWIFQDAQIPRVGHPNVEGCPQCVLENRDVRFDRAGFRCLVRIVSHERLRHQLLQAGVNESFLERADIKRLIASCIAFEIRLENNGDRNLNFNPDQVRLLSKERSIGTQVTSTDFLSASVSIPSRDQELMSRFFYRNSLQLPPGDRHRQLIVFRSGERGFPKQPVTLQLDRMFYGLESVTLVCSYHVRYE